MIPQPDRGGLEIDGLTVIRDSAVAVDAARLRIEPGEVVALLGGNGAGKSSLLRAIAGAERCRGGAVRLDGRDLLPLRLEKRARAGIGWCPEGGEGGRRVFPGLTVDETLEVAASGDRRHRRKRIEAMLEIFPILADRRAAPAWTLSGGQQQMLTIARALVSDPLAVLLDEPSLGLSPAVLDDLFAAIRRMARDGKAVLLAEQNVPRALAAADRVLIMRRGAIVSEAPAARMTPAAVVRAMLDGPDGPAYDQGGPDSEHA